jgi:hypothetical protein
MPSGHRIPANPTRSSSALDPAACGAPRCVSRSGGQTHIQVASAPAMPVTWLINTLGIICKVHRVLKEAPGLGGPAAGAETDTSINQ